MKKYVWATYIFLVVYLSVNIYVTWSAHKYVLYDTKLLQPTYVCIVLGAGLGEDGTMSDFFKDRLLTALELYRNKTVMRLLISGDHGSKDYNEVDAAKVFLLQNGVAPNDIFLDHAGFDTYDSMYRAKEIFGITEAIVVSQAFHLPRAIYIARKLGINATAIAADKTDYGNAKIGKLYFRETLAALKATLETAVHTKPTYLGNAIPITGDSSASWD